MNIKDIRVKSVEELESELQNSRKSHLTSGFKKLVGSLKTLQE